MSKPSDSRMTPLLSLELLTLAALWGASFLFMRQAVPEFGPFALIFLRVAIAGVALLPLLLWRRQVRRMVQHWRPLLVVGVFNSALPFTLISYALLSLAAGMGAILNASAPLWSLLLALLLLGQPASRSSVLGLTAGLAGVIMLVWHKVQMGEVPWLALLAALAATLSYALAALYSKAKLAGVAALVTATGSQLLAALLLFPLAVAFWPEQQPSWPAWQAVILLALGCTALAYLLYFHLIEAAGAQKAISVTLLIPLFGMLWGAWILDETISLSMLIGAGLVLLGTALANGLLRLPR
ncbi:DMT family transporter [Balneatrix alpica]|uniref:DMT family transporter n=1 Tax=Balneatrix alpica TaxID=75684 RepID=UPI0027398D7E|nr:DMT family transporter [Balneatrix alpica]